MSEREYLGLAALVPQPTMRKRLLWNIERVQGYFVTLWQAFRGNDPYDY